MLYHTPAELKSEYDVAVIGGGLGGLTAAIVLAKKMGRRVVLLEQHDKLGGLATWFNRKGHIFDVSLHGFPVGMIKTCKRYWNEEIAASIVQLSEIRFENPQFSLSTTFDEQDFTSKLVHQFKLNPETVSEFFKTARRMEFVDEPDLTVAQLFERFFPGRNDVVRLLMEPITYANGSTLSEPALTYGIVFSNFMSKGVFTFQGGTDLLISKMQKELLDSKVDIALCSLVDKINLASGRVQSVESCGHQIRCRSVISNGNILTTVKKMVGEQHFSDQFRKNLSGVRLNNSSCQVYMGVRSGEKIPEIGDLIFCSEEPEFIPEKLLAFDTSSRTFSLYYPKTRPGTNRYSIVASSNAKFEDWTALSDLEYSAAKKNLCEITLKTLEKFIPGVRSKIDYIEAATPRTFHRYTLHEQGASFGTKFEGLKISMGLEREIGGLFHTGSVGIIMSGWLGAANYGVIVANNADKYLKK
ncbi:MAG: FAD-dependent oxidoreductase [Candidatus Wallbacteria bacterium]|nr:FAD-dependent oxidoreductase [Candidatus Wallbacteria bacterium]